MANLKALLILLVAVAAVASASAYTTVVTTTTVMEEEGNPKQQQSCEREMQQWMPMRKCMMWMQSKMRGPHNDAFLRSAVANPRMQEEEHLQECCSELKKFSPGCQCDAIEEMAMQQHGQMEEVRRMACSLPNKCGTSQCSCGGSSSSFA